MEKQARVNFARRLQTSALSSNLAGVQGFKQAFGDGRALQDWFGTVLLYSEVATLAGPYSDFSSIGGARIQPASVHSSVKSKRLRLQSG
jgi:hypothetical protein